MGLSNLQKYEYRIDLTNAQGNLEGMLAIANYGLNRIYLKWKKERGQFIHRGELDFRLVSVTKDAVVYEGREVHKK